MRIPIPDKDNSPCNGLIAVEPKQETEPVRKGLQTHTTTWR